MHHTGTVDGIHVQIACRRNIDAARSPGRQRFRTRCEPQRLGGGADPPLCRLQYDVGAPHKGVVDGTGGLDAYRTLGRCKIQVDVAFRSQVDVSGVGTGNNTAGRLDVYALSHGNRHRVEAEGHVVALSRQVLQLLFRREGVPAPCRRFAHLLESGDGERRFTADGTGNPQGDVAPDDVGLLYPNPRIGDFLQRADDVGQLRLRPGMPVDEGIPFAVHRRIVKARIVDRLTVDHRPLHHITPMGVERVAVGAVGLVQLMVRRSHLGFPLGHLLRRPAQFIHVVGDFIGGQLNDGAGIIMIGRQRLALGGDLAHAVLPVY